MAHLKHRFLLLKRQRSQQSGVRIVGIVGTALSAVAVVGLCALQSVQGANGQHRMSKAVRSGMTPGCGVIAIVERSPVDAAEPVVLSVAVRNTGKEDVIYGESDPEKRFDITVKNSQGQAMPLTRYGEQLFKHPSNPMESTLRFIRVQLHHGQEHRYRLLINRIYDMSVSGPYSITTSIWVGIGTLQKSKAVTVISLPAKVMVSGFDASPLPIKSARVAPHSATR